MSVKSKYRIKQFDSWRYHTSSIRQVGSIVEISSIRRWWCKSYVYRSV